MHERRQQQQQGSGQGCMTDDCFTILMSVAMSAWLPPYAGSNGQQQDLGLRVNH